MKRAMTVLVALHSVAAADVAVKAPQATAVRPPAHTPGPPPDAVRDLCSIVRGQAPSLAYAKDPRFARVEMARDVGGMDHAARGHAMVGPPTLMTARVHVAATAAVTLSDLSRWFPDALPPNDVPILRNDGMRDVHLVDEAHRLWVGGKGKQFALECAVSCEVPESAGGDYQVREFVLHTRL